MELDLVEQPDGPPSPLQKALADWVLLEQQGGLQSPSRLGWTLRLKSTVYDDVRNIHICLIKTR